MKWKTLTIILALIGCIGLLFPRSSSIKTTDAHLSLKINDVLGLGTYGSYYVLIKVTDGSLNSSLILLDIFDGRGEFRFQSNQLGTVEFSDPAEDYELYAKGGSVAIDRATGYITVSYPANTLVALTWNLPFTPLLPFGFILGMVGLGSMFGGTLYCVHKAKQGDFHEAIAIGFVAALLGFALFYGWLMM